MTTTTDFDPEGSAAHWAKKHAENEQAAQAIEATAADRAYRAGLGVGEWEAFLMPEEYEQLVSLARSGYGTWGRERHWPGKGIGDS